MPPTPRFSYYLSSSENPITKEHPIWNKPLAMTRDHFTEPPGKNLAGIITIADYFQAARLFFEKGGLRTIGDICKQRLHRDVLPGDIECISIILVKHGEFSHPSRVEVTFDGGQICFVLNVAVSRTGKAHIGGEYQYLKKLNRDFPGAHLPQVYGYGEVEIRATCKVAMLLGEWLSGFYEFHISRDPLDNQDKIVVWDVKRGNYYLSPGQRLDLYTQAAGILTSYYDLESFEQIGAWRHAAGDFVVSLEKEKIDLKLITVRQYASMFKNLDDFKNIRNDHELILQALLVFFLNLSMMMRLDRLDGVGNMVWADDSAVQGTLIGFLYALAAKADVPSLPHSALRCFFYYMSACSKSDLFELSEAILATFNPNAPESLVIQQHLDHHIDTLYHCIQQL